MTVAEPIFVEVSNAREIERQLDRILSSKVFRRADRLKRMLRYLVSESARGRAETLKEFSIGVEVFDRSPSFDPRFDAIVRVEARRLRVKLEQYYAEEAGPDELLLDMPTGGYTVISRKPQSGSLHANRPADYLLINCNAILTIPFLDLGSSGEAKPFCAGLDDEIICALNQVDGLRLVAGSGGLATDDELRLREIGIQRRASIVISGSVRKLESTLLRLTIKFLDVASGCYIWSKAIHRDVSEPFTVQSEVATMIADQLNRTLLWFPSQKRRNLPAQNLKAHQQYLLGRHHLGRRTEESLLKAAQLFESAAALDTQYASAYSGIADAYSLLGHYGVLSPAEVWIKTASNAVWAVACDDYSAEAHASLAHVKATQDWDWLGAEREFQRAIELDSCCSTAHHWYGISLLAPLGRLEQAREELMMARALEPTSAIIARDLAKAYYYMGDYESALVECSKAIELNPHFAPAYTQYGLIQQKRGESEKCLAAFERALLLSPKDPCIQIGLGCVQAKLGKVSAAHRSLANVLNLTKTRYVSPLELALLHFAVDKTDQGFAWLEKAFQDRCYELITLAINPRFDSVKHDPRFIELSRRLNIPSVSIMTPAFRRSSDSGQMIGIPA